MKNFWIFFFDVTSLFKDVASRNSYSASSSLAMSSIRVLLPSPRFPNSKMLSIYPLPFFLAAEISLNMRVTICVCPMNSERRCGLKLMPLPAVSPSAFAGAFGCNAPAERSEGTETAGFPAAGTPLSCLGNADLSAVYARCHRI